jgi:nitroreductase
MSDVEIFNKPQDFGHSEPAPDCDVDAFRLVVESRRSVRVYTDDPIPEAVMRECLRLALLAPNSSNLQTWQFFWVRDADKKKRLVEYCLSQPAARTAQELVVAVARPDFWRINRDRMLEVIARKDAEATKGVRQYYSRLVPLAYSQGPLGLFGLLKRAYVGFRALKGPTPRGPVSHCDMRVWSQKTTALACQNLMLSLRAHGYDSCPMEGMDPVRIRRMLGLPRAAEVCMVISAGKRAPNGVYGNRIRFDQQHFIKEV